MTIMYVYLGFIINLTIVIYTIFAYVYVFAEVQSKTQ